MADAMELVMLSFVTGWKCALQLFWWGCWSDRPTLTCEWGLTGMQEAFITTMVFAGMTVGSWGWGVVGDAFGRRRTFLAVAVLTMLAGMGSALAPNYGSFLVAQGFVGLGVGGVHIAFTLFSEFLPSKGRARTLIMLAAFFSLGGFLEALLAWYVLPSLGWRALVVASSLPLILPVAVYPWLPESPRYFVTIGMPEKAAIELRRVAQMNGTPLFLPASLEERPPAAAAAGTDEEEANADPSPQPVSHPWWDSLDGSTAARTLRTGGIAGATQQPPEQQQEEEEEEEEENVAGDDDDDGGEQTARQSLLGAPTSSAAAPRVPLGNSRASAPAPRPPPSGSGGGNQAAPSSKEMPQEGGGPGASRSMGGMHTTSLTTARKEEPGGEHGAMDGIWSLLHKDMRRSTLLLWVIWFVSAFSYYGLILAETKLFAEEREGRRCPGMAGVNQAPPEKETTASRERFLEAADPDDPGVSGGASEVDGPIQCNHILVEEDFLDVVITTIAEFPGLILISCLIDLPFVGRKRTLAFSFAGATVLFMTLILCTTRSVETALLFATRAFLTGGFQAAYVYTPETYPNAIRATGVGVCSALARVGGMITPYVAQQLMRWDSTAALVVYAMVCASAALAAMFLPFETRGLGLPRSIKHLVEMAAKNQPESLCGWDEGEGGGSDGGGNSRGGSGRPNASGSDVTQPAVPAGSIAYQHHPSMHALSEDLRSRERDLRTVEDDEGLQDLAAMAARRADELVAFPHQKAKDLGMYLQGESIRILMEVHQRKRAQQTDTGEYRRPAMRTAAYQPASSRREQHALGAPRQVTSRGRGKR